MALLVVLERLSPAERTALIRNPDKLAGVRG
jgi:hypothetical protein